MHPMLINAVKAAREAGRIINRASQDVGSLKVQSKTFNDFVSDVDRAAEQAIIDTLRYAYPDHAFLGEESGEMIVLRLTPALKWVMMALSALHAHSKKELGHILELCGGFLDPFVPSDGRVRDDRAGRGQDLADDLVVGRVCEKIVPHPGVEGEVGGDISGICALILE